MPATVYIMSSASAVIYTGVTGNLKRRVYEHKFDLDPDSFTARHCCHQLVYFEEHGRFDDAIAREKQLKRWRRSKKVDLILSLNPGWSDLSQHW